MTVRKTPKRGRPPKRTKERRDLILRTLRTGLTRRASAEYADMDRQTLLHWMQNNVAFCRAVVHAEAEAEVRMGTVVANSAFGRPAQFDPNGRQVRAEIPANPTDAKWWRTHRRHQEWGERVLVDIEAAIDELAEASGLDKASIMAEVDDILDRD